MLMADEIKNNIHSKIEYAGKTYIVLDDGTVYVSNGGIYRDSHEPLNFSTSGVRFLEYMLIKNGDQNFINSDWWY